MSQNLSSMISNGNLAAKQKQKPKCATCAKVNKTDQKKNVKISTVTLTEVRLKEWHLMKKKKKKQVTWQKQRVLQTG